MKFLITCLIAALSMGCAQIGKVGNYAGMDLELGYGHSFIDSDINGGKKAGFFFPNDINSNEDRVDFRVRILLRPEED